MKGITLVVMSICCVTLALSDMKIFNMDAANPVTNSWIGGNGQGSQTTVRNTSVKKSGSASVKWTYTLPGSPGGNYPTIEMAVPAGLRNWTGATSIGVWMYFDIATNKTDWTIQPNLQHPYPTGNDLGNWNVGTPGIAKKTWTYHEWPINSIGDISNLSHLRFYYHDGDWASVAVSNKVVIYLDEISAMGTLSSSTTYTYLTTQPGYDTDFQIFDTTYNEFVGYISPKYNYGRWTDIRGWRDPNDRNLLANGGGFYDHCMVWWTPPDLWSDGTSVSFAVDTNNGKVIQWHGSWANASPSFFSNITSQQITVTSTGLIVVKTDTKVTFNQATNSINGIWVEFGWLMNSFATTAIVHRNGYSGNAIVSMTAEDMSGSPAVHYFDGEVLNSNSGDYIVAYGGTTFNVAAALVPVTWDNSSTSYCRSWDTNGAIDQTDTIELHYYNPTNWYTEQSVTANESHRLVYYLVISALGQTRYDWVPSTSELAALFTN